jgi:hypothetical protein
MRRFDGEVVESAVREEAPLGIGPVAPEDGDGEELGVRQGIMVPLRIAGFSGRYPCAAMMSWPTSLKRKRR